MKTYPIITHYLLSTVIVKIQVMDLDEIIELKGLFRDNKEALDFINAILQEMED